MKHLILSCLIISFLAQSCYTYKTIDINTTPLVVGHKYKISENNEFTKVKLKKISDSTLTVTSKENERQISLSKIETIKERKFSVVKTGLASIVILSTIIGITILNATSGYYSSN